MPLLVLNYLDPRLSHRESERSRLTKTVTCPLTIFVKGQIIGTPSQNPARPFHQKIFSFFVDFCGSARNIGFGTGLERVPATNRALRLGHETKPVAPKG